ncbi:MAG: carboxymuconolactone decarboxylase family protein [Alphaproteobacteria bacterium]
MADKGTELLRRAHKARGFHLGVHEIMVAADPEHFAQYQGYIEAAYTGARHLDRKTKEFLHIVVNVALATDVDQVTAHILAAKTAGATEEELFEVCSMMFVLGGSTALLRAMEAWRLAFRPDLPRTYELVTKEP